ncbi:GstE3, partial [Drosophila busckii]
MGKLVLYGLLASPPTRSCCLTLKALDLPYEFITINLMVGEHMLPEYLQKNPQHTVPLLQDDELYLWDSHAINAYLVRKYGKDDALYPSELVQRAVVDQRLHYDTSLMFTDSLRELTKRLLFLNESSVPQSKIDGVAAVYDMVENFLGENDYVAGSELTIADFSYVTSIGGLTAYLALDAAKYPAITAWWDRMKQLPYYEQANAEGAAQFEAMVKAKTYTVE